MAFNRYYDPAQCQSDQKDLVISQLKAELFELRQKEKDCYQIKDTLSNLENRYQLLFDEKQRIENDQQQRLESNQRTISLLNQDSADFEKNVEEISINLQDLAKSNQFLKTETENKQSLIYQTRNQLNEIIDISRKINYDIQQLEIQISKIQLEKNSLIDENNSQQIQDSRLNETLSMLETNISGLQEQKVQLEQELQKINDTNKEINETILQKNEEIKMETQNFIRKQEQIQQNEINIQNVEFQINNSKMGSNKNANSYQSQILRNQDLNNKIQLTEGQLNLKENQLNAETKESNDINQENIELKEDNKIFNEEIEKHVTVIKEQQLINKNLITSVEQHIGEDDTARQLLARRERMKNFLQQNQAQIKQQQLTVMSIGPKVASFMK